MESYATNVLNIKQLTTKVIGSSINFLSVVGYTTSETFHPEIDSLVEFIKQISVPEEKQTLEALLK